MGAIHGVCAVLALGMIVLGAAAAPGVDALLSGSFHWLAGGPLIAPAPPPGQTWTALKDPSVVFSGGRWHLYCTLRVPDSPTRIVHLSFADWADAGRAPQQVVPFQCGSCGAPEVFYFEPQKKWYFICQASDPSWEPKYGPAYSTSDDVADTGSWAPLRPLGARKTPGGKTGLDFWVICDEQNAYLFFTTNDGHLWREQTRLTDFPSGWSEAKLAIQGDIFEASNTYLLQGVGKHLTIVEAQNGHGWRYFKAYLSDRLDGEWTPIAATKDKTFASMANVEQSAGHWTDSISHGELLRAGVNQRLEVDPQHLRFLFQGVSNADRAGKPYGLIPWRLGMLEEASAK